MTSPRQHGASRKRTTTPSLAVVAALMLIVASCGSGDGQSTAGAPNGAAPASDGSGLQYGDSVEDWAETQPPVSAAPSGSAGHEILAWEDLVPPGASGEEVYERYADRIAVLEDGSPEAEAIYEEMMAEYDSGAVNTELDGKEIVLAGFIAPLTYADDVITEFLLVPYFGACIHVPPPPPNQTVMVTLNEADGLSIEDTWGAVWVKGNLTATPATTDLATAGYTIDGAISGVQGDY